MPDISSTLTVRRLDLHSVADAARWDAFVSICPQATFFHRAGWQEVISKAFGHDTYFIYAEADGNMQGILALGHVKSRLFGNALTSLPFTVYGGVAALNEGAAAELELEAQRLAKHLNVDHLELRNVERRHDDWPLQDLYVTFRRAIAAKEEDNLLAIPRKQRAMVRKGIKFGLESVVDEGIERFFSAYSASLHRLGTPVFSKKYFRILKEVFADDCELMIIVKEGRTVSGVMSFYFRDEVSPYYGGGTGEARDLAGNDFMYWELMRRACERGYKIFDFGRSKYNTGSFDFKKNWGFEPQPLYYQYQLHRSGAMPDHNPLNPKYQLFIKAWQKLPISVANFVGPHIVKNLG